MTAETSRPVDGQTVFPLPHHDETATAKVNTVTVTVASQLPFSITLAVAVVATDTVEITYTPIAVAGAGTVPDPATATPLAHGTAAVGTALKYAREDHRHPSDAPLVANANPLAHGTVAQGSSARYARQDHVHPSDAPLAATATPLVEAGAGAVGSATKFAREDHVHPAAAGGGGGSLFFLGSVTASSSATVDLETTIDSTYDAYMITAEGVIPATDVASILCTMKIGGSYLGSGYYYHLNASNSTTASYAGQADAGASDSSIKIGTNNGNASTDSLNFVMYVHRPSSTALAKNVSWTGVNFRMAGPRTTTTNGAGSNSGTGALTGIRFAASSGNVASGTFRLYGIKNS